MATPTKKPATTRTRSTATKPAQRPTTPQDRQPSANKARAEAASRGVTFTYDETEYSVGPEATTDVELLEAVEDQRYIAACRGYLGKAQWNAFKDDHRDDDGRVEMSHLEGLLQALMEALGNS